MACQHVRVALRSSGLSAGGRTQAVAGLPPSLHTVLGRVEELPHQVLCTLVAGTCASFRAHLGLPPSSLVMHLELRS